MPRLLNTIALEVGADEVWGLVGDLEATPEWIPGIVAARVDGEHRVCTTADGQEIHERVKTSGLTLTYEQDRVPLPIQGSHGTIRVLGDGTGSRVEWEAEFDAPDEVAAMVDGYYKQTLESLRERVRSSGAPPPSA